LGHQWQESVANFYGGRRCPYCSNRRVLPGFNDLATKNPKLAAEWDSKKNIRNPAEIASKSNIKVWWICKNGHEWEATVSNRSRKDRRNGCPYCDGGRKKKKVI